MKRSIIISAIGASLLATSFPFAAYAEGTESSVSLRIEGVDSCIYYGDFELSDSSKAYTVADVISGVDELSEDVTVTGVDDGYITDVNGVSAGTFGGWDGWLYRLNNVEPTSSINETAVKAGDEVVLYYSDEYGIGMQFPVADTSQLENGILTFTSSDAVYAADYSVSYETNPVEGMSVDWKTGEETTTLITDKNGQVIIPSDMLTVGSHAVSVSKVSENGVPLVLRFAPDYEVNVEAVAAVTTAVTTTTAPETTTTTTVAQTTTAASTSSAATTTTKSNATTASSPKTGDVIPAVGAVGLTAILTLFAARRKK